MDFQEPLSLQGLLSHYLIAKDQYVWSLHLFDAKWGRCSICDKTVFDSFVPVPRRERWMLNNPMHFSLSQFSAADTTLRAHAVQTLSSALLMSRHWKRLPVAKTLVVRLAGRLLLNGGHRFEILAGQVDQNILSVRGDPEDTVAGIAILLRGIFLKQERVLP